MRPRKPDFEFFAVNPSDREGAEVEVVRLLRLGGLGWLPPEGGVVFVPTGRDTFETEWDRWLSGPSAQAAGMHLLATRALGEGMEARELMARGAELDGVFGAAASERSREAGTNLLRLVASARRARLAERLLQLTGDEGGHGGGLHLAGAIAVQSLVFNMPPLAALLGYAFAEWRGGRQSAGKPAGRDGAERFAAENPGAGEWAAGLLRRSFSSFPLASFG